METFFFMFFLFIYWFFNYSILPNDWYSELISFVTMLYKNFDIPKFLLVSVFIFRKDIKNILQNAKKLGLKYRDVQIELHKFENDFVSLIDDIDKKKEDTQGLIHGHLTKGGGGGGGGGLGAGSGGRVMEENRLLEDEIYLRQKIKEIGTINTIKRIFDIYEKKLSGHSIQEKNKYFLKADIRIREFYYYVKNIEDDNLVNENTVLKFQILTNSIIDYVNSMDYLDSLERSEDEQE